MPFVILPTNSISGGYDITNSLRFNSGSSDYLVRTPSTTTNRRTWTWSGWVKRATISGTQVLFGHNNYPTLQTSIRFTVDNTLSLAGTGFSGTDESVTSNQVFRDTSAWYHLVVAVDTTQATSSDRVKLYSNGTQITSFLYNAYPTLNLDTAFNYSSAINYIGATNTPTANANLYMAEVNFIDGQQLTPSSFGETDLDTGIWKPKAYTGTYGTNGFYLQFKNSASLGTDSSGNGNTFTVNNLTSVDQSTDTPTNNFATMNPLTNTGSYLLKEGNLYIDGNNTDNWSKSIYATMAVSKGKWYWEAKATTSTDADYQQIGVAKVDKLAGNTTNLYQSDFANDVQLHPSTPTVHKAVGANYDLSSGLTTNDIIMMALDMDNGKMWVGKNGTWFANSSGNTGSPSAGTYPVWDTAEFTVGETYVPTIVNYYASTMTFNFGNPIFSANSYTDGAGYGNFSYSVPSGYYSLNTRNLAQFG